MGGKVRGLSEWAEKWGRQVEEDGICESPPDDLCLFIKIQSEVPSRGV